MNFNFNQIFELVMESNDLDTVIILGHMNPDGDAAGCVMGLAHYIYTVYPQYRVIPHLAKTLDKGPKKQVTEDKAFDPFALPEAERYAVIICDTATKARIIGREFYENAVTSIVIDHHASNEGYGDYNFKKISEACSENIYYCLDWERWKTAGTGDQISMLIGADGTTLMTLHPNAADYIYMGILHDTGCFARAESSIFAAASGLLELGVSHRYVMRTMHNETLESLNKRSLIINMAERTPDGKIAWIYINRETALKYDISYEDIHPVSAILRDCENIELGISMYEEAPNSWRCSCRSDGQWIDVNELLSAFGGGGHAGAAGLRKQTEDSIGLRNQILRRAGELCCKA